MPTPTKNTLITVLGSSPQVLTESLYALKDTDFPDRIVVFTTTHGAEQILRCQLATKIKQLCAEYSLPVPTLDHNDIIVVKDREGRPISDIRNTEDQSSMADSITSVMRELSRDDNTAVHASIAGGRKSMSFYMGYIFSIFARPFDKLSHVLVSPEFESSGFWYTTKKSHRFIARTDRVTGETIELDAKDAIIELAEIPFLRLNSVLSKQGDLLTKNASYRETLAAYQLAINPEAIRLVFTRDHRILLNNVELSLPVESRAFYFIIAKSCLLTPCYQRPQKTETQAQRANQLLIEAALITQLAGMANIDLNGEVPNDLLDEILESLQDKMGYRVNVKAFNTIEEKGFTLALADRMISDITIALKGIAIGSTVELCEVAIVRAALNEDKASPFARVNTKGGFYGLRLNPAQIVFQQ